jgi:hypothetical protein
LHGSIDPVKICSCYNGEHGDECEHGREHQTVDGDAGDGVHPAMIHQWKNTELLWDELFPAEQTRIVAVLVERVECHGRVRCSASRRRPRSQDAGRRHAESCESASQAAL